MAEKCQRKFDYSDLIERYQKDQRFQGQMIRNGYNEENMRQFEQWKYEKENKIKQSPFFHQRTAAERSHGKRQFQVTRPPASEIGLEPHKTAPRVACDDYSEMRSMADRCTKESQQLGRSMTTEEIHDLAVGNNFQVSYTESRPGNTVRLRANAGSSTDPPMLQLQDVEDALHFKQRVQEEKEVQQHQLEDEALTKEEEEALRIAHAIEGMIGPEEVALRQQQDRDERRIEAVWGSWRDTDDWQWHDASLKEEYEKPIDYWTEAEWWQQHAWQDDHAGSNAWPSRSNYQQQQPQQQQQQQQRQQRQTSYVLSRNTWERQQQQTESWWPNWAPWWQTDGYRRD